MGSVFRERMRSDGLLGVKSFTYRLIPDHEGSRGWASARLRCKFENLELFP